MADEKREFLRHTLATLAYRGGKAVRGASAEFAGFSLGENPRTPAMILAHIGDLLDWAVSLAEGNQALEQFESPCRGSRKYGGFMPRCRSLMITLASRPSAGCESGSAVSRADCRCA